VPLYWHDTIDDIWCATYNVLTSLKRATKEKHIPNPSLFILPGLEMMCGREKNILFNIVVLHEICRLFACFSGVNDPLFFRFMSIDH
jgi:hypothetical protein